ncbi:TetR/AcrR family transcriptional regulator, partial [Camelimonas abortus]
GRGAEAPAGAPPAGPPPAGPPPGAAAAPAGAARRRDAEATRRRILKAAQDAFARDGYAGARIDRIARAAACNVQMIYRYFGDKEGLYLAALEAIYLHIRSHERQLRLTTAAPAEGVRRLVEFTFDYLRDNPNFVAMVRNENLMEGRFVRRLRSVSETANPLVETIGDLLRRGAQSGDFRTPMSAMDLYLTVLGLCVTHCAQRHTLSAMFRFDFSDPAWQARRREQVVQLVLRYLTAAPGEGAAGA